MSYELLDKIAGFEYCHELFLSRWLYFYQNVFISSNDQTGAPSAKLVLITPSDGLRFRPQGASLDNYG